MKVTDWRNRSMGSAEKPVVAVTGFEGVYDVVMDLHWVAASGVWSKIVSMDGNLVVVIARHENGPWTRSVDDYAYSKLHSER